MKKLLFFCLAITVFSCSEKEPKDYATLSGKIGNPHPDRTLRIFKGKEYEKLIKLNEDGTFKDTLKIVEGKYTFFDGNEYGQIFLKNNNTSSFTLDTEKFDESLVFEGDAADQNNLYVKSSLLMEEYLTDELFEMEDKKEFTAQLTKLREAHTALKATYPTIDSLAMADIEASFNRNLRSYESYFDEKLALLAELPEGSASPTFEAYENYDGSKTSLADLKGKYVYIDIWATWCGPCKAEIPSLKKLEQEFHGKNLQFLSISIDDDRTHDGSWEKANTDWRAMVASEALGGIQLFAPDGWKSQFITDYKVGGIPRFILLDPEGKVVSPDAPRPSSEKLREMLSSLPL